MNELNADLRVLLIGHEMPSWQAAGLLVELGSEWPGPVPFDAVVCEAADAPALQALLAKPGLQQAAGEAALVVIASQASLDDALSLTQLGAQDVLTSREPALVRRAIQLAVARKKHDKAARLAFATDLTTGLPHQAQLLEHVSQMIALRTREPAPLVLIVLRLEGLRRTAERMGQEAANIQRRKLAVRLRGALRASDVVASTGPDTFGVLLGHVDAAADGQQVVAKLLQLLKVPLQVAGQACEVAVAAGLACWPEHGREPVDLLRRAHAQAASEAAMGAEGYGSRVERGFSLAANDDQGST